MNRNAVPPARQRGPAPLLVALLVAPIGCHLAIGCHLRMWHGMGRLASYEWGGRTIAARQPQPQARPRHQRPRLLMIHHRAYTKCVWQPATVSSVVWDWEYIRPAHPAPS